MPTRVMNKGEGDEVFGGDQSVSMGKKVVFEGVGECNEEEKGMGKKNSWGVNNQSVSCSDESSSIGKNSDLSENSMEKTGDGEEVESSYKGSLDSMEALEEVLPIRRSISSFYNGKSKSFASLAEASASSSIKDIAKPENAYMRRRRNLLSCSLTWDKNRNSPLRGNSGGVMKRVASSNRTTLALAVAMNNSNNNDKQPKDSNFAPWRSFSLVDLQQCVSVANGCMGLDHHHKGV